MSPNPRGRASPTCPRCLGAVFLYLGGAHIDQQMVFGVLIILLAMFPMQAGTRDWTANTAAPFLFTLSSIIVLQVPEMLKAAGELGDGEGVNAEVMSGVFAIVISFLLSRLLDRNKSENQLEIENVNVMGGNHRRSGEDLEGRNRAAEA